MFDYRRKEGRESLEQKKYFTGKTPRDNLKFDERSRNGREN